MKILEVENSLIKRALEDITGPNYREIFNFYKKNPGFYLLHGRRSNEEVIYKKPREDRYPKDTDLETHFFFDKVFKAAGFEARRSNSLFCTGDEDQARSYGAIYVVFPMNGFHFTWSDVVSDFTESIEMIKENTISMVEDMYYDHIFEIELNNLLKEDYVYLHDEDPGMAESAVDELRKKLEESSSIIEIRGEFGEDYDSVKEFVENNPHIFKNVNNLPSNEKKIVKSWIGKNLLKLSISSKKDMERFFPFFVDQIKTLYSKDNLYEAINHNVEIMVRAGEYILISKELFHKEIENKIFK